MDAPVAPSYPSGMELCVLCGRTDVSQEVLPFEQRELFLAGSHEGASLCACRGCGHLFLRLWREVGGWEIEDMWRYWAPISAAEADALRADFAADEDRGLARASALVLSRRRVVQGPGGEIGWSDAPSSAGLWMHT